MNYNHKWWHFIYGKELASELVHEEGNISTSNYWDVCKKCGKQLSEKQGSTTVSFNFSISSN